jgi:hypothetical protein
MWEHFSSKVPAYQLWGPEFNPSIVKAKTKQKPLRNPGLVIYVCNPCSLILEKLSQKKNNKFNASLDNLDRFFLKNIF